MRKVVVGKPDWATLHKEVPPEQQKWSFDGIDPDIWRFLPDLQDPILEVGCGNGYQLKRCLAEGRDIYGTEVAQEPIDRLTALLGDSHRGRLWVDDIRQTRLNKTFSAIIDRGVFHVFNRVERLFYVQSISKLLRPEGKLIIKCFSDKEEDRGSGPFRLSRSDLEAAFSPWFDITHFEHCEFQMSTEHFGGRYPKAFLAVLEWRMTPKTP
jgi:SAM-dependent methyltransferase